jgi:hypothetical protein
VKNEEMLTGVVHFLIFLPDVLLAVQILTHCPGQDSVINESSAALWSKYNETKSNAINELLCRLICCLISVCEFSTSSKCTRLLLLRCLIVHHFA